MINLIPPSAKKNIAYEYWKRVITVWLYLASAAFVILTVFLLPTQVVLRTEISSLTNAMSAGLNKVANYDISATELTAASSQAKLLLETQSSTTPSDLIRVLTQQAGTGVTLNNFQFKNLKTSGAITLSGTASTRQSLANFRDSVSTNPLFANVDLPISNLIKDKDLLFSMEITLATTTKL